MVGLHLLLFPMLFFAAFNGVLSTSLNVTVVGAQGGMSRFECWTLAVPFDASSQHGIIGTQTTVLGDVSNITYNVIPVGFDSGFHTAPANQWVVVLNGMAVFTLVDNNSVSVTTSMGEMGLLFFAET
ncbi:putative Cupin type-1 domain-containing protein [Seiridium cardinale]